MGKITLGEVAIESKATWKSDKVGVPIVGLEHLEPGEITLSNWEIDSENTFTKKFLKGQVLLGRRRVYLRKAVIAPVDGICSGDITVIEAIHGKILPELLPFVIQNDKFFDYAVQGSAGSLSPRVKWEHLKKYSFELPSIDEQKVLANKLWAAYRLKESYKKLLFATDEMVKSQFIEMQMKSGQTNSLGDFIERCTPNRCGERTDLPILSVTKDKAIVFQDERFGAVVASNDKSNYIIAPRGYLVQGIHIDESNFGIQNLVDEGIVSPAYKLWRFKNNNAIPELIEYFLRSEMAIKYFQSKFLGATVPRRQVIRKEDFLDLPLNLPNMEEQKKYFRIYQQADKSKFISLKSQFIEMFGNPLSSIQKNELKRLGDCCHINPRRSNVSLNENDLVSFVPMSAVNENGYIDGATDEEYGKVKKGFTYFENDDVLFAKITPCMENGKGAVAEGLTNGIGMGSTEFHILRPITGISNPYWLLALTRMPIFRERAAKNMSGTGGQRRVGSAFLENFMIGLPSISEQDTFEAIYKQADKSKYIN